MKIKITQAGWEGFTGDLGSVEFVDGVNVEGISRREALVLGSFVTVVELADDGSELGPVSPAHELVVVSNLTAPVVEELERGVEQEPEPEAEKVDEAVAPVALPLYVEAELKAIADAKGIAGLRDIGDKLDVKDTSVRGLIAKILHAQANPKSEA